jgi:endo-1,4-beta-xylanase
VHAHTLVWHESLPPWMRAVADAQAVKQVMLDHIDHVAGHFRGHVAEWDVINEPMSDDDPDYGNGNQGLRPTMWFRAMGEQFIDLALARAHAADPAAKLFINEYGCEDDGQRWTALLALVTRLKQRGAPLDGVGFQNHEYTAGDRAPASSFRAHVQALQQLGLSARVSEMDVLVGSPSERAVKASEYAGKLQVCRQEPSCSSFTSWGLTDRYGSTANIGQYPPSAGDALLYDENLAPKPAYNAVQSGLR